MQPADLIPVDLARATVVHTPLLQQQQSLTLPPAASMSSLAGPSLSQLQSLDAHKLAQAKKKRLSSGRALADVTGQQAAERAGATAGAWGTSMHHLARPRCSASARTQRCATLLTLCTVYFRLCAMCVAPALVLNDDESEKARLRAEKQKAAAEPEAAAPIAPLANKRKSLGPVAAKLAASGTLPLAAPKPTRKQMEAEEWQETMKLASSGKFNSKNTALVWGNDLISQMRDLLLGPSSKSGSGAKGSSASFHFDSDMDGSSGSGGSEQSSQFQKASCTLDASMMIYSSRVDDVHKSTFRVLGGLSNQAVVGMVHDSEDEEGQGEEGKEGKEGEVLLGEDGLPLPVAGKKKKTRRLVGAGAGGGAATLEPNPSKLDARLIETSTDPDPLFALTTAKFEGAGASGMLMTSLSVYSGARITVDSSEEFVLDSVSAPRIAQGQTAETVAAGLAKAEAELRMDLDFSALESELASSLAACGFDSLAETVLSKRAEEMAEERDKLKGVHVEKAKEEPTTKKGKAAATLAAAAAAAAAAAIPVEFDFAAISLPEVESLPILPSSSPSSAAASDPLALARASELALAQPLPVLQAQMEQVVAALQQERALEAQMEQGGDYGGGDGGFGNDENDEGENEDGTTSYAGRSAASASAASSVATGTTARSTREEKFLTGQASYGSDEQDGISSALDALCEGVTNWAGIKHWKFKAKPTAQTGAKGAAGGKKKRAARGTKDLLDFSTVPLSAAATLCTPASNPSSLRLADTLSTGWERRAREASLRLPEDKFYRVRNLQTLCQKPGVLVKLRSTTRRVIVPSNAAGTEAGQDVSMSFSPSSRRSHSARHSHTHAHAHAAVEFVSSTPSASGLSALAGLAGPGVGNSPLSGLLGQPNEKEEAKLGALQFDDGGINGAEEDDGHENEPLGGGQGYMERDDDDESMPSSAADGAPSAGGLMPLAAPVRAERITIGYARVSKKVDVKALKTTMWSALQAGPAAAASASSASASASVVPAAVSMQSFSSAISSVASLARGELASQLPSITPSYYFISLLHLCNEHNLKLEDTMERQKRFGDFNIIQQ